jgi:cobalt/nickel transport system permease protein
VVCETYFQGESVVHRLDPRIKFLAAMAFSLTVATSNQPLVLAAALAAAVVLALPARLPFGPLLKRMATLNVFVLLMTLLMPLSTPGRSLATLGPLRFTYEGLALSGRIALKSNAIVLAVTVLLSTVEITRLGHAMSHLRLPSKLIHLMLMTVRYVDVLHHEYHRLATAMKVRGFRAAMNMHTYRSLGNLVGMLLVRSFDRSQRIVAAMKCRGFNGRFYVLDHFRFAARDAVFAVLAGLVTAGLVMGEYAWPIR